VLLPFLIAAIVFVCTFGGGLVGIQSRDRLPEHHLSAESKDVVRLCMGLIATLTALVLGLVTASAKEAYDAQGAAVRSVAAGILVLDRTLERYGPDAAPIREQIRLAVSHHLDTTWLAGQPPNADAHAGVPSPDDIEDALLNLAPKNDRERWLQSQALSVAVDVLKTRWLALAGAGVVVPLPFLVVIVFWLTALFWSFGLFARSNRTVIAVLLLAAASVAASVLLILEMQTPFAGIMRISSEPLEYVLGHLGK
jgi:hypothetical protein